MKDCVVRRADRHVHVYGFTSRDLPLASRAVPRLTQFGYKNPGLRRGLPHDDWSAFDGSALAQAPSAHAFPHSRVGTERPN
jgi:hypothetical protein